jgi:RNA polymerase sigma-70 factor (ECF subfamily)
VSDRGLSEAELMRAFTAHRAQIYGFAYSITRDFHLAEDVLQDVSLLLIERRREYDSTRPFANWALGITRRKALECLRMRRDAERSFDDEVWLKLEGSFVRQAQRRRLDPRREALANCMQQMGGRGRSVLEMKYDQKLSARIIAGRIGKTLKAVNSLLQRLRARLIECVNRRMKAENRW